MGNSMFDACNQENIQQNKQQKTYNNQNKDSKLKLKQQTEEESLIVSTSGESNIVQENIEEAQKIQVRESGVNDFDKISLSSFKTIKVIGQGSFGKVYLVEKNNNGKKFAMKILEKKKINTLNKYKHTIQERKILESAQNPFVVSLRYAFQTPSKLFFVMDLVTGGELFQHLKQTGAFSEKKSRFYIAEILMALEYLHKQNIIFRDLKPENVLLDSEGHIKITDFGLAKELEQDQQTFTLCGTPEYLAPEILKKTGYGKEVDYWTLGILLYEFLTVRTPFKSNDRRKIFENILTKQPEMPAYFSPQVKDLLIKLLVQNPQDRLGSNGIEEIKQHSFFEEIDWELLQKKQITVPYIPPQISENMIGLIDPKLENASIKMTETEQQGQVDTSQQMNFEDFTMDPSHQLKNNNNFMNSIKKKQRQQSFEPSNQKIKMGNKIKKDE